MEFKKYSKLAIVSFVLNLIPILILLLRSIFINILNGNAFIIILFVLPSIAFVTSIVSLVFIKRNNLRGKLIVWISLVLAVIIFIIALLINWFPPEIFFE